MFKNPSSNIDLPVTGDIKKLDGMQDVRSKYNLDVGRNFAGLARTQEELFEAVNWWWTRKYRKKEGTIKARLRIAQRMSEHAVFPVNWLQMDPNQILSYLEYREYTEKCGPHAIKNEWKTVCTFARAYGINPEIWGYVPPSPPPAKIRIIPLPSTVKKLTSYKYCKDKYTNKMIQYVLFHGFLLGFRPSEIVILQTTDLYLDDGYLILTEPKKYNQQRQVFLEPELVSNDRRKSFSNLLKHREKLKPDNNYLYLQKNGRPFSVDYLRSFITSYVKPVLPYFSLYTMRHWCATARLIQTKEQSGRWDIWAIKEFLGHDELETTQGYVRFAEKYYRMAKYDWISALLKFYNKYKIEEQKGRIKTYLNKPLFRVETTGVANYEPTGASILLLLLKSSKRLEVHGFLIFQHLTLPLFSFFYNNDEISYFGGDRWN